MTERFLSRRGRASAKVARRRQLDRLPQVLHGLARELRAGAVLQQAVRVVANDQSVSSPGFRAVIERIDGGSAVVASIDRWAADLAHPDADLVRAVLNTGVSTGGAMAASLDRAAGSLRERVELQSEIRALSSQARMSALVLTIAPLAFLAMMVAVDHGVLSVVVASGIGRACFGVGLVLDVTGWWWMRHLVDEVVR